MKKTRAWGLALIVLLFVAISRPLAYAMTGPGNGGSSWFYKDTDHHWYYFDPDGSVHTGWLRYEGEWYWFDSEGRMAEGGYQTIDGVSYYFFINGNMAWDQYLGFQYLNENGQRDSSGDVRLIGRNPASAEERDLFSDYLYQIPRGWLARMRQEGWQLMFYTQKSYFEAPDTDQGIYYVYHSVDTHYRKIKFTNVSSVLQAMGEYIGASSGCFVSGDPRMEKLWEAFPGIRELLEIPDYYSGNSRFYFGKLLSAYLDDEIRESLLPAAPEACRILEEILHCNDEKEAREAAEAAFQQELEQLTHPENGGWEAGPGAQAAASRQPFYSANSSQAS